MLGLAGAKQSGPIAEVAVARFSFFFCSSNRGPADWPECSPLTIARVAGCLHSTVGKDDARARTDDLAVNRQSGVCITVEMGAPFEGEQEENIASHSISADDNGNGTKTKKQTETKSPCGAQERASEPSTSVTYRQAIIHTDRHTGTIQEALAHPY